MKLLKKKIFNGKSYKEYKTKKAQEKFAESLITIGLSFYIASFSPLINLILGGPTKLTLGLLAVTVFGVIAGFNFREEGLRIIDEIESEALDLTRLKTT